MDAATETYVLLLLADSNLPTGAFVASAGLESYAAHGLLRPDGTHAFLRASLDTYAHSALPFVSDAHAAVASYLGNEGPLDDALARLRDLDALYEAMTLNHVARRASRAQGVALLTLFVRGFTCPLAMGSADPDPDARAVALVDAFKLAVRREDTPGHLPICWAILACALGLSAERARHLHLFLHARGVLSAAVRLNTLGPYAAQQLLRHAVRPLVDAAAERCALLRTDGEDGADGPAATWPLGEILAARHDLQHSRIFNS